MGWFSADEILTPIANASNNEQSTDAQTIALCVLAAVAVGYIATKLLTKLHRQHIERVADRTIRLNNLNNV